LNANFDASVLVSAFGVVVCGNGFFFAFRLTADLFSRHAFFNQGFANGFCALQAEAIVCFRVSDIIGMTGQDNRPAAFF